MDALFQKPAFRLTVYFLSAVVCAIAALLGDLWTPFRVFFFLCAAVSVASFVVELNDNKTDENVESPQI